MLITESRAEVTEDIRHFQPLAGHGLAVRRARFASGTTPVLLPATESSGLAVAQTLLVAIRR